ncbi:hypothetical protein NC651_024602 [Populus alba x Populus x berolinensis]|nr:hypothetical protein NC651_024602 [Populus alba x Populus x berolinensis]
MRHQETPSHRRAQAVSTFEKTSTPLPPSLPLSQSRQRRFQSSLTPPPARPPPPPLLSEWELAHIHSEWPRRIHIANLSSSGLRL